MKTRFPDEFFELSEAARKAMEPFRDLSLQKEFGLQALAASAALNFPKIDIPKDTLLPLSESMAEMTSAFKQALTAEMRSSLFSDTVQTALEAYRKQLKYFELLEPSLPYIHAAAAAALSDSLVRVADYYRPYMTDDQIDELEETIPELASPETRKEKPRLSKEQILRLISFLLSLVSFIKSCLPDPQLGEIADNQIAQIEQDSAQHEEEIAILAEMSAASQEMNDLLQRIADSLEDADTAADLIAQDPGDFTQPDNDLGELTDPVGHDGDTDGHDQDGDAEQPAAEP